MSDSATFKSLLAAWSLVVVVVMVAGFSFRWTYLYNFGLQDLLLQGSATGLPIYAIELLRTLDGIYWLIVSLLGFLLPFQIALLVVKKGATISSRAIAAPCEFLRSLFGLESSLVVDAIRAALLVFVAFVAGGLAGYRRYETNVLEQSSHLPRVGLMVTKKHPLAACYETAGNTDPAKPVWAGERASVEELLTIGICPGKGVSWRLLYRDEKYIYIFRTVVDVGKRPITIILPSSDDFLLVLN